MHLDENRIAAWLDGSLSPSEIEATEDHIDVCHECRLLVAEATRALSDESPTTDVAPAVGDAAPSEEGGILAPGTMLGGHVVLEVVGAGAMGVVYSAYDPKLDRKVALKLIRPDLVQRPGRQARLVAEAQAMARLAHPNVLTVHDIGRAGESFFIEMELVRGGTLSEWLRVKPRSWREILRVFVGAGRGLAGAHAAGILHRDFKPENVLVDGEGRALVSDFGLAKALEAEGEAGRSPDPTRTAIAGTPAYMSPEQLDGGAADVRSDVYGFCATLFEALYRRRPHTGSTTEDLAAAIRRGATIPPRTTVPAWLGRVVERGLRPNPDERYPSMASLLSALDRDPARTWKRAGAACATLGLIAIAVLAYYAARTDPSTLCRGAQEAIADVWGPGPRAAMRAVFTASKLPYAGDAFTRAQRRLDAYAGHWVRAQTRACRATRVHGTQSEDVLALRMRCLRQQRRKLAALVQLFLHPDAKIISRASEAAANLPDLARCGNIRALKARYPPPRNARIAKAAHALRASLAKVQARLIAGRLRSGLAAARDTSRRARALDYRPLRSRATLLEGLYLDELGEYREAAKTLSRAYFLGLSSGNDRDGAEAAIQLIWTVGRRLARYAEGHQWAAHAQAVLRRMGGEPSLEARRLGYEGAVLRREGRYQLAVKRQERAIALLRRLPRASSQSALASQLNNLAVTWLDQGRWKEGARLLREALRVKIESVGPHHPAVARIEANLGRVATAMHELPLALEHLTKAERILLEALGPKDPQVARVRQAMAMVRLELGHYPEALALSRRARRDIERRWGKDVIGVARSHYISGAIFMELGLWQEAARHHRAALAIQSRKLGARSTERAWTVVNLAEDLLELGQHTRALRLLSEARATFSASSGKNHPGRRAVARVLGRLLCQRGRYLEAHEQLRAASVPGESGKGTRLLRALVAQGDCFLAQGKAGAALKPLERAAKLQEVLGAAPRGGATARFLLARALWAARGDRRRALRLARSARAVLSRSKLPRHRPGKALARIEAWLAARTNLGSR